MDGWMFNDTPTQKQIGYWVSNKWYLHHVSARSHAHEYTQINYTYIYIPIYNVP